MNGRITGHNKYKAVDNFINCSRCGFIPLDKCQMDRHHINGDKKDNRIENIEVMCANCHRLVTFTEKKGIYANRESF